jgi:2-polyprenyl-3-methyl-5-hydroxy-6-metoxy-1,4-benzoquinol methylase
MRVLDLACGEGRHVVAAAKLGAEVVGVDADGSRLEVAQEAAAARGLTVDLRIVDLAGPWPALGVFDAVLVFNYLDRTRMRDLLACVAPGGVLLMETFLTAQRQLGWGPRADEHLLLPGELARLILPFEASHGREVFEPVDSDRWRAVASVVAERRPTGPAPQ